MEVDNQWYNDSVTARAYIRNMADQFEDSEEMLMFLSACDKAQAALVCWLFQENRYIQMQLTQIREVQAENMNRIEVESAWNEYCRASEKFKLAKENLKNIICYMNLVSSQ